MDYEKKYKELEGKIKKAYLYAQTDSTKAVLEDILPELAESEDEKIRKEIVRFIQMEVEDEIIGNKWIAWLVKQGEKPADKIKPKFKVGDWIVDTIIGGVWHIDSINKEYYKVSDGRGNDNDCPIIRQDEIHLWSIEDAKDGDVLYSLDSNQPFIYKARNGYEQATAYCGLNIYRKFFVWNTKDCIITLDKYIPATKEQRDKLLNAMADAGWTFDFEKKELKKIEQNSAWNEEDEQRIKKVMHIISCDGRIDNKECKSILDWLESLKDRYTWKPSNIQMECLYDAINHYHTNGYPASKLSELYEQMSKIYKL